jgi:hypothetical protein
VVQKLRNDLDIPLSFIEDEADEPINLPVVEQTLEDILRAIADRYQRYRCEVFAGRLVLRSSDPVFDVMISGVDLVEKDRFLARRAYIDYLRVFDQRFKDWYHPLIAMAGDSPIFYDQVTLSPRAPVVLHLVQLLGRDRALFFEVPAPRRYLSGRTIVFGEVRVRRPWDRIRPLPPPPPADQTGEKAVTESRGKMSCPHPYF